MTYVQEQMTMDDVLKVIDDVPEDKRARLNGHRGSFRYLLDATGEMRQLFLREDCIWAIEKSTGNYLCRRPFLPDAHYYVFRFKGVSYFVGVCKTSRYGGDVGEVWYSPPPPTDIEKKFQSDFVAACHAYGEFHPINFEFNKE